MSEGIGDLRDNREASRYEAVFEDGSLAYKEYRLTEDKIAFRQTVVPGRHGGKGVAARLDEYAATDAARRNLTVIPGCPYIEE